MVGILLQEGNKNLEKKTFRFRYFKSEQKDCAVRE